MGIQGAQSARSPLSYPPPGHPQTACKLANIADDDAVTVDSGATTSGATQYERSYKAGTVLVPRVRRRMPVPEVPAAAANEHFAGVSPMADSGLVTMSPVGGGNSGSDAESQSSLSVRRSVPVKLSAFKDGGLAASSDRTKGVAPSFIATGAASDSDGAADSAPSSPPAGNLSGKAAMDAIVEDMNDLQETVHQLDGEALDAGYGEVKSPLRHVRTRLYFTSESHVQALVNTLKYWGYSPHEHSGDTSSGSGGGSVAGPAHADESFGRHSNASSSRHHMRRTVHQPHVHDHGQQTVRLVSAEGMRMLNATPELDYLTHIVLRLYENYTFPPGHPQRHRLEVLFSPGASFSPVSGEPRTPRVPLPPSNESAPVAVLGEAASAPSVDVSIAHVGSNLSLDQSFESAIIDSASSESPTARIIGGAAGGNVTPFVTPDVVRPTAGVAVFSGPSQALASDMASHTLPVAGVLPLQMSLTLQSFEDVISEAIYYGSQVAAAKEQHPKEEAKARAALAALARARGEGY